MAVDKTIKINVDGSDAIKDLKKVSSEVDATFADLRRTTPITLDGTKAKKVLGEVDSKVGEVKTGAREIGPAAEGSAKGFNVMNISVKAVAASLKAAGIGLVISLFVKLGEALSKNQVFMDKFNIVTETIGITFQKLVNTLVDATVKVGDFFSKVGRVIKKFVSQDLDGIQNGLEGTDGATKKVGKSTRELAEELVNLRNEVKLAEAQQRLLQLTFQKDAEIQRQIRDDVSLTIEERIKANNKLADILDEQFAAEKVLADKKLELAQKEAAQNEKNIDLQVAVINAQAELADLEERITGQRSENKVNAVALAKELAEDNAKLGEQEKAIVLAQVDSQISLQKEVKKTTLLKRDAHKEDVKMSLYTQQQKEDIMRSSLGSIGDLVDKESKKGKKVAKALAIIDTFSAANKALAQGGIFGIVAAAGVVAAGIANVKAITAQRLPKDDDGGGDDVDVQLPGPTGMGALTPNMEAIDQPTLGEPQPVQAFVVESNISNAQALQEELDVQATL